MGRPVTPKSWNVDVRALSAAEGFDLSVKNPDGGEVVIHRSPQDIIDEDALLISEDSANLLARSTPIAFPASGKYWVNNRHYTTNANSPH